MSAVLVHLADCRFYTRKNDRGRYTGHCVEYPSLRTLTHQHMPDALDEIITLAGRKIAELEAMIYGNGPAKAPPHPSDQFGDTW